MPRGKAKNVTSTQSAIESPKEPEKIKAPDIGIFKFEKKPHIKVEFEKDTPKNEEESKGLWEPANWKDFLINLRNMRSNNDAPVDSMGCHMTMDENAPPKVMRYQSLIALMLSSQTKDQVTFAAMERLRDRGLTVDNVLNLSDEELGKLIYPVGFWKTKVKYIKKTTQTLKEQYDGDIPDSVDKLCKLTGVGPKMAHICMQVAWNKTTGIGVDTHVHRISNRIGWVKKPTATPEDTRKALQSWLPFDLWSEVNHLMVGFGQTICQPVNPMCYECLNRDICPSSEKLGRKSPNKKSPLKQNVKDDIKQEFVSPVQDKINLVSPKNQIITSKSNSRLKVPDQETDQCKFVVKDPSAPSRKRKISPKKYLEIVYPKDEDPSKLHSELSPNKKRVSPKKEINEDNITDIVLSSKAKLEQETDIKTKTKAHKKSTKKDIETIIKNNMGNAVLLKKTPNKTKAATDDEILQPGILNPGDNEDTTSITEKIRSDIKSAITKSSKLTNTDPSTTQAKRKSPRNKN